MDNDSRIYQLKIAGLLEAYWKDWFGGMDMSWDENGYTLLTTTVPDQAGLHGLLKKVRNAGMTLESVIHIDAALTNKSVTKRTTQ